MVVATLMSFTAMGQLLVTPNNNAVDLANALIAPGSGVTISAATYTGGANSAGTFSDATVGITSGVLLTSGLASIAIGPNNAAGAGAGVGFPGDPDRSSFAMGIARCKSDIKEPNLQRCFQRVWALIRHGIS